MTTPISSETLSALQGQLAANDALIKILVGVLSSRSESNYKLVRNLLDIVQEDIGAEAGDGSFVQAYNEAIQKYKRFTVAVGS